MSGGVQRLGKNLGGYFGETIDIEAVLKDCVAAARTHGWTVEEIPAAPKLNLLALTRTSSRITHLSSTASAKEDLSSIASAKEDHASRITNSALRIYISAGIHGDEPAGPLAVRQLLSENQWPADVNLWLCPCLNPAGCALNRRTNAGGLDLNRQYRQPTAPETLAHIAWLKQQPGFDLCLCLHEDWEARGFYVFEANPDNRPSIAEAILKRVAEQCPLDLSETIEGWAARNGIIRPGIDPRARPEWPEALYLITNNARLSYTFEAPSDFPLPVRVAALVAGVRTALEAVTKASSLRLSNSRPPAAQ